MANQRAPILTTRREALLRQLSERPASTVEQIAAAAALAPSTVHYHLERMAIDGLVTSRVGRWRSWRTIECLRHDRSRRAASVENGVAHET